jgi:hypothetical protein
MAHSPLDGWKPLSGGLSLACLFSLALGRKRRNLLATLCMLLVGTGLAALTMTGCGGSNHSNTVAGSYSLTITASANGVTHSQTLPVTITNSK